MTAVAREAGTRGRRGGESKNVIMGIMAKVVIVGGAGYVGVALTDLLLKTDHQVRVYDEAFGFAPKRGWDEGMLELKAIVQADQIKNVGIPLHSNHHFPQRSPGAPGIAVGIRGPDRAMRMSDIAPTPIARGSTEGDRGGLAFVNDSSFPR